MSDRNVIGADADLDELFAQIDALRVLADGTQREPGRDEIYDFSIRWGTLISGRLPRLAYYNNRGELSPLQEQRFRTLCDELRSVRSLVDRLGIVQPRIALG